MRKILRDKGGILVAHSTVKTMAIVSASVAFLGLIWTFLFNLGFFAGFYDAMMGNEIVNEDVSEKAMAAGFIIASVQHLLTIACFVFSLLHISRKKFEEVPKRCGTIMLVSGIIILLTNVLHLIPAILLIIAGIGALNTEPKKEIPSVLDKQ